ncbi:MAG: PAS domain-containing [Planctomycetota bacterium]|nr:MAG: PAS domain-containing [Planctomycetota bacterium]
MPRKSVDPVSGRAKASGQPASKGPRDSRISVLLVDDRAEDLMVLEAILGDLDVHLVKASSGEEALRCLLDRDFSAILLDVHLPGMNGFETAELIRKRERSRATPIIFLTGEESSPVSLQHAYAVGAADFIMKPISAEAIRSKVSVFVELARAMREVRIQAEQLRRMEDRQHRRLLEQVTEQRNRIFALSPDLICIAGFDGNILEGNPRWEGTLGWTPARVTGRPFLEFVHPDDRPSTKEALERLKKEPGAVSFESRFRRAGGDYVWLAWTGTPYPSERLIYAVARDVSESKRAAVEALRLNTDLERRVSERTAQLESANKELESFSYSVSHDLRAPLRAIEGFTRRLVDRHASGLDAEGKRLTEVVLTNTRRMAQLIDDLLAFSRMGRAELIRTRVDMRALAGSVSDELRAANPGRKLDFRIGELAPAWGDQALLRQVLANLFSNAVKYTRPRECAEIEFSSRQDKGETVWSVRDNGVGFEEAFASKLFGVFQRLHSSEEFEGTGVGLALVQRVILRHGGRVWAEGKTGTGAVFHFSLPTEGQGHAGKPA